MALIKALNVWSLPGGLDGSLSPYEAIQLAKEHRFDALELAVGATGGLTPETTEEECAEIVAAAKEAGVQLLSLASGLYWSRAVGDPDNTQAIADLKAMLKIAGWLGAKTLLVIPGAVDVFFLPERPAQRYDEVYERAKAGIAAVLPDAEAAGVRIGIENVWNRLFMSPLELRDFIDSFGSEYVGAYFDVGNVLPFGYPEQWLRILGKRVVGVHFKDYRRAVGTAEGFVDLLEGDVNWPEVIAALGEIGYDGPVAAEMIPHYRHYPIVRTANASTAMDAILG